MRGWVHKKGARWCVVVDLERDPATKKRQQKWHGSWSTKREAEIACSALVKSVNDGAYIQPSRQRVAEYLPSGCQRSGPQCGRRPSSRTGGTSSTTCSRTSAASSCATSTPAD